MRFAIVLGLFTITHNLAERVVSNTYGSHDESLTLFEFGVDIFIECLSVLGIFAMILHIQRHPDTDRTAFEKTALRTTFISFCWWVVGLLATDVFNIVSATSSKRRPSPNAGGLLC